MTHTGLVGARNEVDRLTIWTRLSRVQAVRPSKTEGPVLGSVFERNYEEKEIFRGPMLIDEPLEPRGAGKCDWSDVTEHRQNSRRLPVAEIIASMTSTDNIDINNKLRP